MFTEMSLKHRNIMNRHVIILKAVRIFSYNRRNHCVNSADYIVTGQSADLQILSCNKLISKRCTTGYMYIILHKGRQSISRQLKSLTFFLSRLKLVDWKKSMLSYSFGSLLH